MFDKYFNNLYILTFDIEDWFHTFNGTYYKHPEKWDTLPCKLESNTDRICQFLEEKNIKATFFWLGWEANRHPKLIRKVSDLGHEIGVHSYYHFKINELTENEFRTNMSKSIQLLEDCTGKKVKSYRAPGLSINEGSFWAFEILKDLGIEIDSSFVVDQIVSNQQIPNHPLIIDYKGITIKEFPISSFSLFKHSFNYAGSGYFRITPYWFLQKKMINSSYIMSYFHPRDFDLNIHKLIYGNPLIKLKYRVGSKNAYTKLEKLTQKINWFSIENVCEKINWKETEIIKLP